MQKITIGIAPNLTVEISSDNVKEIVERASFWSQLPHECPKCKAPVVLFHRDPNDNSYWGLACTGPVTHETNFGVYKNEAKGFYYKGEWQEAYPAYQNRAADQQAPSAQTPAPVASTYASDAPPTDPVAKSLGDMVTAKQLGMIRAIGREKKINEDNECAALMHCSIEELSKRAASDFITHLQQIPEGTPMARATPENAPAPAPAAPAPAATAPSPAPTKHPASCTCPACDVPF